MTAAVLLPTSCEPWQKFSDIFTSATTLRIFLYRLCWFQFLVRDRM